MSRLLPSILTCCALPLCALAADGADTPLGRAYVALLEPMQFAKIVGEECDGWTYDADKAARLTQAFIEGQMDAGVDPDDLAAISSYLPADKLRADFGAWLQANHVAHGDTDALCAAGPADANLKPYLVKN
ncbi:hypothetical protein [Celeribacter sp.]|uniref:hypothetical protein n=1 Tax=Celeribacter sp. TaxID=1890673 RepID=UPI003A953AA1